jgi:hypothetical protein
MALLDTTPRSAAVSTLVDLIHYTELTVQYTVLGCMFAFVIVISVYRFHVRKMNRLLGGTEEEQRRAMKSGVTQQQVDLGWRYIGF